MAGDIKTFKTPPPPANALAPLAEQPQLKKSKKDHSVLITLTTDVAFGHN